MASVAILKKTILRERPIGRSLKKMVRDFDPKLDRKLSTERNYSESLYAALGLPGHGCEVCGIPTRFLSLYRGYTRFCSRQCRNQTQSSHYDRPQRKKIRGLDKLFVRKVVVTPKMYWRVISSRYREFVKETSERLGVTQKQIIYHMFVSRKVGTCQVCGDPTRFRSLQVGYSEYCSPACSNDAEAARWDNIRRTSRERYGRDHVFQTEEFKNKSRATCRQRYGKDYAIQSDVIRDRARRTNVARYGSENPFASSDIRKKIERTNMKNLGVANPFSSNRIKRKIRKTNMERYGAPNPTQNALVRAKIEGTCLERLGCKNPFGSEQSRRRARETSILRYGTPFPTRSKEVQARRRATCLQTYGVDHPNKDPDVFARVMKNHFRVRTFRYAGRAYQVMGYEDRSIRWLIDRGFRISKRRPSFSYECSLSGKIRSYHPDVYAESVSGSRYVIEVKSPYTAGLTYPPGNRLWKNLVDKATSVEASGMSFVLQVVHRERIASIPGVPNWQNCQSKLASLLR